MKPNHHRDNDHSTRSKKFVVDENGFLIDKTTAVLEDLEKSSSTIRHPSRAPLGSLKMKIEQKLSNKEKRPAAAPAAENNNSNVNIGGDRTVATTLSSTTEESNSTLYASPELYWKSLAKPGDPSVYGRR